MKKVLSIFLSAVMILAVALPVLAASSTTGGNFKVGTVYYDDFLEAINAAPADSTITMTKDVTVACDTQNKFAFTKNLTVDGGGYTLSFTCEAKIFPIVVNNDAAVVEFKNFKNIKSDGGIFAVTTGTLKLTDLTATGKGRATAKTQGDRGTSNIIIEDALITFDPSAGSGETTMILTGSNANDTVTLKNGAIVEKTNKANNAANAAAAVIYFMNNDSNFKLVMESGSKIIGKHAAGGNTTASILGHVGTGINLTVEIAEGAYLINESSNTSTLNFIHNSADKKLYLTAHESAFLVKSGLTPTITDLQGGVNDGGAVYKYTKLSTSPVAGYDAYKASLDPNFVPYFEYTNDAGGVAKTPKLSVAIAGAKSGTTIKLISDYVCTESELSFPSGKTLTLDLQKHTLDATADKYFFSSISGKFTIKDGTLNIRRGLVIIDKGELTFDTVTAIVTPSASGARPLVKLSGDSTGASVSTTKLVVRDSTLKTTSTGEALILVEHFTKGSIALTGTTTISHEGTLNGNNQNNAPICLQNGANLDLEVGQSATIRAAHKAVSTTPEKDAERFSSCIADQTVGTINITLYKGATLKLDREATLTGSAFITQLTTDGEVNIINKGANFVASAEVAKIGFDLPESTFGYVCGGTKLAENSYANANATDYVTVNEIIVEITMEKGAAIRTVLPFGLNFAASIDTELFNSIKALDPNAAVKFVIATTRKGGIIGMDHTEMMPQDYKIVDAMNTVSADGKTTFDYTMYIGEDSFITTADSKGFKTDMSARAFITFTVDGEEITVYTDYSTTNNSRSIYTVATKYYEDTTNGSTTNLVINHILETCGYEFN